MNDNKYHGLVKIKPKEKFIEVKLKFDYVVKENNTEQLEFSLYKHLEIKEIICDDMLDFVHEKEIASWSPFIVESRRVIIKLKEKAQVGQHLEIIFNYSGVVEKVSKWQINRITEELIELGLYAPWYPLIKNNDEATFDLKIKLPEEYHVVNADYFDGFFNLKQDIPNADCTILASNKIRQIKNIDNGRIDVFYMLDEQKDTAEKAFLQSNQVFNYFSQLFGPLVHNHKISICLVSRSFGGGYSRPNLVVLHGEIDLRFLSHEVSHLWWNKANYHNDWLNESFAEYSALMMIRELDQNDFEKRINHYIMKTKNTHPIPKVKRSDDVAFEVLYHKGPALLYQLENEIGRDSFIKLLHQMHEQKIGNTNEFFILLEQITTSEVSNWFKYKFENE